LPFVAALDAPPIGPAGCRDDIDRRTGSGA
jgi:hypothetical protein